MALAQGLELVSELELVRALAQGQALVPVPDLGWVLGWVRGLVLGSAPGSGCCCRRHHRRRRSRR